MPVMANDAGRLDIGFARGTRFSWSARWEQSLDGGRTYTPVDLTGWDCVALLYDACDSLMLEKPCTGSANGLATCVLDAGDTLGDEWEGRAQGTWRILARQSSGEALSCWWEGAQDDSESILSTVPDLDSGDVELLAWGYWRCD